MRFLKILFFLLLPVIWVTTPSWSAPAADLNHAWAHFGPEKGQDDPPPADNPPPDNPPADNPPADNPGGDSGNVDPGKIDLNQLKNKFKKGDIDKAMNLLKTGGGTNSGGDSGNSGTSGGDTKGLPKINLGGEVVTADSAGDGKLDASDKQYCEVHIKNAKRNYRKKQYERAMDEVNQVLGVDRNHPEAHFMKAVLEAKRKAYVNAWREIEISRKDFENEAKFKDFVARLQKVSPKPDSLSAAGGSADRSNATHVSELVVDRLEDFFAEKTVSGKVSSFGGTAFTDDGGKVVVPLHFQAQAALDPAAFEKKFKDLLKTNELRDFKAAEENKKVDLQLVISGLPKSNPSVKPVKGLAEFLKETSEECDVRIEKSEEGDTSPDKFIIGGYTLVGRGIGDINNFLRRVSPHADYYYIEKMEYTSINSQTVLKGAVKIRLKVE